MPGCRSQIANQAASTGRATTETDPFSLTQDGRTLLEISLSWKSQRPRTAPHDSLVIFAGHRRCRVENQAMFALLRGFSRALIGVGAVAVVSVWLLLGPLGAAALAHGAGPLIPDAAYYHTGFSEVIPATRGVTVRVDPAGEWIELTNTGPAEIVVLGYIREPYLRVTSTVVEENQLSQSTYINRSLFADSVPTGQDSGTLAPAWKQTGTSGSVRWHDHRIHWMGQSRPPVVDADPRNPHMVGTWTVHATADGVPFDIRGDLQWIGKPGEGLVIPQWVLWVVDPLVLIIGILGLFLWNRRRQRKAASQALLPTQPREEPPKPTTENINPEFLIAETNRS
jgi:hypothetical protein